MSSLTRFTNQDGIELVIDCMTGVVYVTALGYAILAKKSKRTILNRCKTLGLTEVQKAGQYRCVLIPADIVFKWLIKDNVELAEIVGIIGITNYLYQLVGNRVSKMIIPIASELPQTYTEALRALLASKEKEEELLTENLSQATEIAELKKNGTRLDASNKPFKSDYFSILQIVEFSGLSGRLFNWQKLNTASKAKRFKVRQQHCSTYGVRNFYHREAWKLAYPDLRLPTI